MKKLLKHSALILTLVLTPIAYAHEEGKASKMMGSSPYAAKAPYDIQFLDTMAQHHREGIEMFQMGIDKAQNDNLRDMAKRMKDDQEKEISELKSMREDIKSDAPEAINRKLPGMEPMNMSKLESSEGKDFDKHFIDMTIQHHKGALAMSKDALKRAKTKEVKDKAEMIIDMQKKEISKLKEMK